MSRIRTNLITNRMANGAPTVSNGLVISGVTTVTTLDLNGDLDVDGHLNADNVSIAGVVTATTFVGDGAGLTGIASTDNIITGTAATFNTYPVDINAGMTVAGVSTMAAITATTGTFSGTIETTGSHLKITGAEPRLTFTDTDNNPDFQILSLIHI